MSYTPAFLSAGEVADLANCDREPIRIPSLIQPHGLLLAARLSDMRIVYASENVTEMLGVTPEHLFGKTLTEMLGQHALDTMQRSLGGEEYFPQNVQTWTFPSCGNVAFDVWTHRIGQLLCVELERAAEARSWDLLSWRMQKAIQQLRRPKTLEALCAVAPRLIRDLTGYDRAMVYRFDPDGHGEVIAEEKERGMEPFLGLHYPATDIPQQARELYVQQRIRSIADVNYKAVRVLGNWELVQDAPLDMTYCALRSVSPIHIEYLQNMGVGATFGISLIVGGKLWGMVLCHHRERLLIPPETRVLCDSLGQLMSLLIGLEVRDVEVRARLEKRGMLEAITTLIGGPTGLGGAAGVESALAEAEMLLPLAGADGALIRIGSQVRLVGRTPGLGEACLLMEALQGRLAGSIFSSEALGKVMPEFAHLAGVASGVLLLPLKEPRDGILWFRGQVAQSVRWAGKPDASKAVSQDGQRLSPRKSFAMWEEVKQGCSLPWQASEVEAALGLQRVVVKVLLQQAEELLARLSYADSLTQLPNRKALVERMKAWQERGVQAPAAILFLDLDQFREVNDAMGHEAGDELLKQVGERLSAMVDGRHMVARLGGDEFVVLCEDTSLVEAEEMANSILRLLPEPFLIDGRAVRTTASIGVAPLPAQGGGPEEVDMSRPLRAFDSAMYVAKHKGGNQVSIVQSREHAETLRRQVGMEVEKRQRAAKELAIAYARLEAVMDSTSEGILQIDHKWVVLYANRRAVESGVDFQIGKDFWSNFPAISSPLVEQQLRKAMQERTETEFETYSSPGGQWFKVRVFPTRDGMSLFFSDISVEKNMQDRLTLEQLLREKRIEALSHMAGGLAHEISNPLAIIHGRGSDLLARVQTGEQLPAAEVGKACESIVQTADRAMRILRGLRGFAREGQKDPMEPASVEEIVEQCMEMQHARLERHGIEVILEIEQGMPPLLCREVQVGQIVTNLLNNGFDAIVQAKGTERWMKISAWHSKGETVIEVVDSGPGIEDHFKAHLMEPFFTTKELGLGMGVGLSLSRAIAQDHGGTLTLCKDTPNTRFQLVIPDEAASIAP